MRSHVLSYNLTPEKLTELTSSESEDSAFSKSYFGLTTATSFISPGKRSLGSSGP